MGTFLKRDETETENQNMLTDTKQMRMSARPLLCLVIRWSGSISCSAGTALMTSVYSLVIIRISAYMDHYCLDSSENLRPS